MKKGESLELLMDSHVYSFPDNMKNTSYHTAMKKIYRDVMKHQSDFSDIPEEKIAQYHEFYKDADKYLNFEIRVPNKYENKMYDHMRTYTKRKDELLYKKLVSNDASTYRAFIKGNRTGETPLIEYFNKVVQG